MPTLIILQSPKSASLAVAVCGLRSLSRICMAVEHLLWVACTGCSSAQHSRQSSFSCPSGSWVKPQRPGCLFGQGRSCIPTMQCKCSTTQALLPTTPCRTACSCMKPIPNLLPWLEQQQQHSCDYAVPRVSLTALMVQRLCVTPGSGAHFLQLQAAVLTFSS